MIHKFRTEWQFWLRIVERVGHQNQYKIMDIAKFASAENFARYYHLLPKPGEFKVVNNKRTSLAVFRGDIHPAWEDPENAKGGYHSYEITDASQVNDVWRKLLLVLLSEELSTDCNGVTCGIKQTGTLWVSEVWMKTKGDQVAKARIDDLLKDIVGVVYKNFTPINR
jgi:translation initiation factor 4E